MASSSFKILSLEEVRKSIEEEPLGKENINKVSTRLKDVTVKHETSKGKVGSLQDSLDGLHTDIKLAKQLCENMERIKAKKVDINHRIGEIESLLAGPELHSKEIEFFEKYCGISVKSDDNGYFVLSFNNIDPNDCRRQFSITLSVNDVSATKEWTFVSADPHFDGIPELTSQLNTTNDIHSFCSQLRKFFKTKLL